MPEEARNGSLEERFQAGDERALVEIYRRHSAAMFATALKLLGNREYAAEAVQLAFVQAWRGASRFDHRRGIQPWLYAITRRTAIDVYRRERRSAYQIGLLESWDADTIATSHAPSIEDSWRTWQVRAALDQLRPAEREVLYLAYFEQMTQSEIAAVLDVPVGTVKSRTARSQQRLARLLAHLQDDAPQPVA
ncbi:RNA polymerase sigma factor [Micromonospora sp. NPDC000089]|uniref:RNA polymerase sigma factor n=1 Tax=unclassified Micromonospora TaxID=2617518 RepID=UPI0036A31E0E